MDNITIEKLVTDEIVALGIIEIKTIPHKSIMGENVSVEEIVKNQKVEIINLLSEIHNLYKTVNVSFDEQKDISIELLFSTYEAKNQPFKAYIRQHIIVRAIDSDENNAKRTASMVKESIKASLALQKYEFVEESIDEFREETSNINADCVKALVKNEQLENLQNQLLPYCYDYDKLPTFTNDLSRIVSALIECPDVALSIQLMPTTLYNDESSELDRLFQGLDILSKGVNDQGMGNVSFVVANKFLEKYKYYSEHKNSALYLFNIVIYGQILNANSLASKVLGQFSSGDDNTRCNFKIVEIPKSSFDLSNNFYPLPFSTSEVLMNSDRDENIWQQGLLSESFYRLPYIITDEEAAELFRLPVGNDKVNAGLVVNESKKVNRTYSNNLINSGDITLGKLKSQSLNSEIGIKLNDLAKHMLVVGTPGSGKTTFSVGLLDRLWKDHKIPFLVIEPAKNEYRALVQSIPELQVFTPGKNFISPFVYNPFVPPKNVKLEGYKSTLKTAFAAGVSMVSPLDKIFEDAINNCYSDFRWLDTYTINDGKGKVFNIDDFVKCFQETFEKIGYTGDAMNIGRAGLVRLKGLQNLFDNYFSIPIEDLLSKPTIIELAAIENSDQKALIIALVLLSILSYVNANYVGEGGLKNVILVEEAHVLLDSSSSAGEGEADPSAIAKGLVKRMLAEIRSYGVGLIIADQSPRKVSTDVVALTDMKVIFRLVENEDKQIIGNSSNMSEVQVQRLAKLKPGEACLFFNRLEEAEEIITPNYRIDNNISISLSDDGIKELSTYWNDKKEKLRPYPFCEVCKSCEKDCDYNVRVLGKDIARRIYSKNFNAESKDFEKVKEVFANISKRIKDELNDEEFTDRLLTCSIVHLWRKIYYETKISIGQEAIIEFLKKNR